MPAQKKVLKQDILRAALKMVCEEGHEVISARSISEKLNCSTQPIYMNFRNMEELEKELKEQAQKKYKKKMKTYLKQLSPMPPYKAYGMCFIRFAKEEKNLFRYIYMVKDTFERIYEDIDVDETLKSMQNEYECSLETVQKLHEDMALYTYGIAVVVNCGYMKFSDEQIANKLTKQFLALNYVYGMKSSVMEKQINAEGFLKE